MNLTIQEELTNLYEELGELEELLLTTDDANIKYQAAIDCDYILDNIQSLKESVL